MAGIHRLDQGHIGQNHLELVGLKMSYEMPLQIRIGIGIQSIDLGQQFLGTALGKDALPCVIGFNHRLKRMEFGHGNQLHGLRELRKNFNNILLYHLLALVWTYKFSNFAIMRKISVLLVMLLCFTAQLPASANDPIADPQAVVICGNARFTVLTSRMIRMEWSPDASFEDRATLAVVNRCLPVPEFSVKKKGKGVTIKTKDLTLNYRGGEFTPESLTVTLKLAGKKVCWHYGDSDPENLLGTTRTLDGCRGFDMMEHPAHKDPFEQGVVSRSGWAVVDESGRPVYDEVEEDWDKWIVSREDKASRDLYFFGYGHDYTAALGDFVKVAGRIPLPPKYTFGYWWCRYWEYSDYELMDLARTFKSFSIPVDVMIIDMDWHETWPELKAKYKKDEFGQGIGWTGFTWKKELFPNPKNLFTQLHSMSIKTSLNLHFNNGIQPYEEPYGRFVKDYLSKTSDYDGPEGYIHEDGSAAAVPFRIDQLEWTDAFFGSVIHPLESDGVDFWWLDWQQWKNSRYNPDLSNTFLLNYAFFRDKERMTASLGDKAPRAMIYHRWGGLGSHRYQVGFSGDTYATWDVLPFLPYFTATASNVGYGYWGHDIGGHMQPKGVRETDPELYTRWLQAGVFTPIFKTHSTKDETMEKRFWVFPEHFEAMRSAIRLRYDLSPYIYTMARKAYDTGISLCRPLYYEWPEDEKSYSEKYEFMFGDDILATAISAPVDSITGTVTHHMWFPQGSDWYDVSTGTTYRGGTEEQLRYTIDENPYFVRAGAVIPLAGSGITDLQHQSGELVLMVAPGCGRFETSLYEDDGSTESYHSAYATTHISKESDAQRLTLSVEPRVGSFDGMLPTRNVTLRLEGIFAPKRVLINGKPVEYRRFAANDSPCWGYDGHQLCAYVHAGELPADEQLTVEVEYDTDSDLCVLDGKKGLIGRMRRLTPAKKPQSFLKVSQCGSFVTEDPAGAESYLKAIDTQKLIDEFNSFGNVPSEFLHKLEAQVHLK